MRLKEILLTLILCATVNTTFFMFCSQPTSTQNEQKSETVSDADGNIYTTVKIGTQIWTLENWRSTKYADGTAIPNVTDYSQWLNLTTGAYCHYENNTANKVKYGALYNWYAVITGKLAPNGWRVPTDSDWTKLENYLIDSGYNWDGTTTGNKIAKALAAKTDWSDYGIIGEALVGSPGCDLSTNNNSGFSALPGGYRGMYNDFLALSLEGLWWSASESFASNASFRLLNYGDASLSSLNGNKNCGLSLRLVRNLE